MGSGSRVEERPQVGSTSEPIFFLYRDRQYSGALPPVYDAAGIPAAAQLEQHFPTIRDEVLRVLEQTPQVSRTNFVPNGYVNEGFRTVALITDGRRYHEARSIFPRTSAICDSLEGISSANIGVLAPGCDLEPHHGDTNVMYRIHLGISVPGDLPAVGLRVADEQLGWSEGACLAFEDAYLHSVWNHTDRARVILLVDVVKPELVHRARWVRARAGSGIVLQILQAKLPPLARLPRMIRGLIHLAGSAGVWLLEPVQHGPVGQFVDRPRRRSPRAT